MQFEEFVERLPGRKQPAGNGFLAFCPSHNNTKTQSLSVSRGDDRILVNCKGANCTAEVITSAMGLKLADLYYTPRNGNGTSPRSKLTLESFAKAKGFTSDFLSQHGVSEDKGSLVFHYLLMNGQRAARQRIRLSLTGDKRFIWNKAEGHPIPYGLWRLDAARKRGADLVLCEGESDSLTLWLHGIEALGVPGADVCKTLQAPHVQGFRRIFIVRENDDRGGETFEKGCGGRLTELEFEGDVRVIEMAGATVKDPNELHVKFIGDAGGFESKWGALIEVARPVKLPIVGLEMFAASTVEPKKVQWLWPKRIPLGKLVLLVGHPGLGKSFVALDIAAHLSNGSPWPDGTANVFDGDTVVFSAEDGMEDTIVPRLIALDAKLGRISIGKRVREMNQSGEITRRGFNLSHDLPKLEKMLDAHPDTKLMIVDPVSAYMARIDSHKNAEVRSEVLDPLSELAERLDVTILAVTHFNKGGGGGGLERVSGSIAFPAAARVVWGFSRDPDDPGKRLMLFGKSNVGPEMSGLAFRILENPDGSPSFQWLAGSVDENLSDFLRREQEAQKDAGSGSKLEIAKGIWREMLADGPRRVTEVENKARELHISEATLKRAAWELGVKRSKKGFTGPWMAALPSI